MALSPARHVLLLAEKAELIEDQTHSFYGDLRRMEKKGFHDMESSAPGLAKLRADVGKLKTYFSPDIDAFIKAQNDWQEGHTDYRCSIDAFCQALKGASDAYVGVAAQGGSTQHEDSVTLKNFKHTQTELIRTATTHIERALQYEQKQPCRKALIKLNKVVYRARKLDQFVTANSMIRLAREFDEAYSIADEINNPLTERISELAQEVARACALMDDTEVEVLDWEPVDVSSELIASP